MADLEQTARRSQDRPASRVAAPPGHAELDLRAPSAALWDGVASDSPNRRGMQR
jgi:hypothetical protein